MKTKSWLLTGAAVGLMALAAAAPAEAASKKSTAAAQAAEIEALKEQVRLLTQRLDAQEAAQQQTQATAVQAQATAQEAKAAQESAAQDIENIPSQVNMAVAAIPKPKKTWAEDTKVSGRMYFDLSNVEAKNNGTKTTPSGTGFDIKRFYVGIDHKFNDTWSANVTTDFQYSSAISATEVYIKKAYLEAKVNPYLTVDFGSTDLPWVPYAEGIYGYRHIENTLIDRTKFGTSADWGVHAKGTLPGGIVSYQVSVINGAGYKAPLRSKGMDVEGRVSAKLDKINLAIGGYSGKLGKDTQGATTYHTANRFDALAAYVDPKFRVGVEYFAAEDWSNVATVASDKSDGYSLFGSYNFTDKISAFGRYDYVKPNKDTASNKKDSYFNIGVQYEPTKIVDLALVYKRDQVEHGTLSTSNGTIGGSNKGTYDEIGLFGQLRW
ncbi:hypothetical protein [Phenylobacterium sp.]|uniref:hypothetical protein n=1 Tax=Phenylobacterium sp. TaxID=1871053 RepID=UPI0035AD8157